MIQTKNFEESCISCITVESRYVLILLWGDKGRPHEGGGGSANADACVNFAC